ncbi:hypothetical protein D9619_012751 [Psilocybe cf. subviscida]|uniref:STE3-domain-containing protein n=1 Tax=Psilocybe cf. subviscida TaxID=2480587 RepID=A0A8H5AQW2_9AGAR|nr:hypothetical protein D9619_012751 [Psilocybe cf. subviscida]
MAGAHPELAPIALLSALSLLLPLPWHWRNGNVATLSTAAWLFVINIIYGVNAVVWANDVITRVPVWCDITTKLIIGSSTALPAAGLCMCIRLYKACSARGKPADTNPRNVRIWEFVACYGIPSLFMALHYIVQGHRFDLIETFGCRPALYFSVPAIILVLAPPIVISLIALVYGVLALIQIYRHYQSFLSSRKDVDSSGNLTFSQYVRLMALALVQIFWATTVSTLCLAVDLKTNTVMTYDGWADVHWGFSAVWSTPLMLIPPNEFRFLYITWYIVPISTLMFVALFSFGEDAVEEYRRCFKWIYEHGRLHWVDERLSKLLPKRLRVRRTSVLPPIEFNKPPSTTLGTYSVNFGSSFSAKASVRPFKSSTDLEKGPIAAYDHKMSAG